MDEVHQLKVVSTSNADSLGHRAQQAVAAAMGDSIDYRLIGGHMVRLLLELYPCSRVTARSTLDADAAVDEVSVIAPATQAFVDAGFNKTAGNAFVMETGDLQRLEINILLARSGATAGLRATTVAGVGQVSTLPELTFALNRPGLMIDVAAEIGLDQTIHYRTRIPDLESAVVLKAHAWHGRRMAKDLADLNSPLEIRQEHGLSPWALDSSPLKGHRLDTARILQPLADSLTKIHTGFQVPGDINRPRLAALIKEHIASVP